MPITLDLRQAVVHKMHGKNESGLREMVEGSIDAQEAALPGLGVVFEIIWKHIDEAKKDELISLLNNELSSAEHKPLK
ncbi:small acid-soluble spore protein SspI [Paenibacillus lentus]|uniref:Small, acid-soluble spore protein I n=1 Tax=Paenibacillus lentus TaxID=1338368 RepID=A0A3Q8S4F9_9BACL|nr:small acid-soluble spore protein SspI [Paenibacillus lentus]AZK46212.1 small acid-soluble spore protein SspI [Paenibacillus lentus]